MDKIISTPICVVCGNKFPADSYIWESNKGFCYCSMECILQSKGFKRIKWSDKYKSNNLLVKGIEIDTVKVVDFD